MNTQNQPRHFENQARHFEPDDLDRILLAADDALPPSSGFAESVMRSLREQAEQTATPPIPFPWKRILPGAVACLCGVFVLLVAFIRSYTAQTATAAEPLAALRNLGNLLFTAAAHSNAGWIALAVALALASLLFTWRLTSVRS